MAFYVFHLVLANVQQEHDQDLQDNEFAEFEDFDDSMDTHKDTKPSDGNFSNFLKIVGSMVEWLELGIVIDISSIV